jgi:hypothetical protein
LLRPGGVGRVGAGRAGRRCRRWCIGAASGARWRGCSRAGRRSRPGTYRRGQHHHDQAGGGAPSTVQQVHDLGPYTDRDVGEHADRAHNEHDLAGLVVEALTNHQQPGSRSTIDHPGLPRISVFSRIREPQVTGHGWGFRHSQVSSTHHGPLAASLGAVTGTDLQQWRPGHQRPVPESINQPSRHCVR